MSTTLSQRIAAILNGASEVEGISPNEIFIPAYQTGNLTFLDKKPDAETIRKVAYLQTLVFREYSKGQLPNYEEVQQTAETLGIEFIDAQVKAMQVSEDSTHNMIMLERLIILVVREAFPEENEVFDHNYFVFPNQGIARYPAPRRRFMD